MDVPVPDTWDEAAEQLLPVLRRCTEPTHAWRVASDREHRLVRRPFAPFLSELVVLDLPDLRVFLNAQHLARWGVSEADAFEAAHSVLADHATSGLTYRQDYGLWHLDSGDGYATSRLLLPGWLAAFEGQVDGRPVAAIPAARVLMVGGEGDARQLEQMLGIAWEGFRTAGGPLSPVLYTVGDGGLVVPWRPPGSDPHHVATRSAERLLQAYEYAEQREQMLGGPELDVQIARVYLVRHTTSGVSHTYCRWNRGEPTLLADTDRVTLVDGELESTVEMAAVVEHAAGCLEPTDLDPPRVLATWPSAPELAALLATAGPEP